MGLGHTFMEQLLLDDHGCIRNLGALDYRIPTIQDVPEALHSILIENEDGPGPYGSKGAGEGGILSIAAAIGAAVNQAAGVRLRDLPLTPERVWRAIRDAAAVSAARPPAPPVSAPAHSPEAGAPPSGQGPPDESNVQLPNA
jgi:xanthine dehydrogenase molybdopterin-binding subunit B